MMTEQEFTTRLYEYVEACDIDIFGIADPNYVNKHARPGRRPRDLFPTAKTILVFGCGYENTLTRAWIQNGKGGEICTFSLSALENRKWMLKKFIREHGYHCFGGETHGGGVLETGIRLANVAASCGIGYIGKSNMLITEKYGPRLNLLYLATDASLIPTHKTLENICGNCKVCETFCSSGAIMGDGYFHARQCESIINCRPNKIYIKEGINLDCDMCQRMCPKGIKHYSMKERTGTWWEKLEEDTYEI